MATIGHLPAGVTIGSPEAAAALAAGPAAVVASEEGEASSAATRAPTVEFLKAERRAKAATDDKSGEGGKVETPPAAGKKPAAAATKGTVAEVDIDGNTLKGFTKLNNELRVAREKIKELEPQATNGAKIAKALKLISEGKNFDAIREVVGDTVFNAAVKEVIGAGGDGAVKPVDPEVKKLREDLDKLKDDNTGTKEQLELAAKAQREVGVNKIVEEIQTQAKEQFPFLSRSPDWIKAALLEAEKAYPLAKKHHGRELTDLEKNSLIRSALEEAEAEHVSKAKLYGAPAPVKGAKPPANGNGKGGTPPAGKAKTTPKTVDATMRGNVTSIRTVKRGATVEELKRERRMRG